MPCPVCNESIGDADHRMCLLDLLKSGTIKTVKEWENMCKDKPMTIRKGKVRAILPKD
jgi:hypothetical protein